jgi:hypothetical protein
MLENQVKTRTLHPAVPEMATIESSFEQIPVVK